LSGSAIVELRSGDLFDFGGPSRLAYHAVPDTIQSGTTNPDTGLTDGRLNISVRNTGLSDAPPGTAASIPTANGPREALTMTLGIGTAAG
jgi:hypothetical protein